MCIDLSESLNKYLWIDKVHMDDIKVVLSRIQQNSYFASFDLASMYHQLFLDPSITDFFGFAVPNIQGEISYYKYKRLPFGTATAVYIMDQLLRPLKIFCHKLHCDISVYIDDGLCIEATFYRCLISIYFIITIVSFCGWTFQIPKCNFVPSTKILYLGYWLNSVDLTLTLPDIKVEKIYFMLNNLKSFYHQSLPFPAKELASFLGKLAHALYTHGNFVRIVSRAANYHLGSVVSTQDWNAFLYVTHDMFQEFLLCDKYFVKFNGRPMFLAQKSFEIFDQNTVQFLISDINPAHVNLEASTIVSDASNTETYAYIAGKCSLVSNYMFTPTEQELSSSFRELLAISHGFDKFFNFLQTQRNKIVIWITDNQCVFSFLNKGSRVPAIQKVLLQIKEKEYALGLLLYVKWMHRETDPIRLADLGSKLNSSSDEYGIDHDHFNFLQQYFKVIFEIDAFASYRNRRCSRFISKIPQNEAFDVDFFLCNLNVKLLFYIHPPTHLIRKVISKILLYSDFHGVLIVPIWRSSAFWSCLIDKSFFSWFIQDFVIFNPTYVSFSKDTIFKGQKKFKTLAILINTSTRSRILLPESLL